VKLETSSWSLCASTHALICRYHLYVCFYQLVFLFTWLMIVLRVVLQGWWTRWPHCLSPILCDKAIRKLVTCAERCPYTQYAVASVLYSAQYCMIYWLVWTIISSQKTIRNTITVCLSKWYYRVLNLWGRSLAKKWKQDQIPKLESPTPRLETWKISLGIR